MSKPVVRVVFSVLLSLAVIVGVYTVAQGAASHAGTSSGSLHVDAGLMPDLSHQRSAVQKLQVYMPQTGGPGHHCHEEGINPNDY